MRYEAGARSWWKTSRNFYALAVPEDLGVLLPEQAVGQRTTNAPMARLAAALLVDAVRCLAYPRTHRSYQDALRYLLGPDRNESIPCELACQLAGISRNALRRRLAAHGHTWEPTRPVIGFRLGHRVSA